MTKEQTITAQLQDMNIYNPAFDDEIHQLCIMERELHRAMKEWKATAKPDNAPSVTSEIYDVITRLRRDILAHRDSLGLTPKGLRRLTAGRESDGGTANDALSAILNELADGS